LDAVDIIILARRSADSASNAELFASLEKHWERLAELKEGSRFKRQGTNSD